MPSSTDLLSTGQAARLLSVTPDTVLKWIKQGRVPAAQTAGGHYRIARENIESLLCDHMNETATARADGLLYCWEYYAGADGINERCEACVVYRARALYCYEMADLPPESGFVGTYCKTSCEDCPYYHEVFNKPRRVLVVTDSFRLRERLQREGSQTRLEFEFATCEYECSTIVHSFLPEYVVIDCRLPAQTCSELCSRLASDPRVPGVQIILAENEGGHTVELEGEPNLEQLPRSFSLAQLEHLIAGKVRPRREVSHRVKDG